MGRGGVGCNPARDCGAVLRDVRRRTARERVRILDLFQDFDRIGHGEVSEEHCCCFVSNMPNISPWALGRRDHSMVAKDDSAEQRQALWS